MSEKTLTISNLKNLFKNIKFLYYHSFVSDPWRRSFLVFISITLGLLPLFSSKALGSLVDELISVITSGNTEYGTVIMFLSIYAFVNISPNILNSIFNYLDRVVFYEFSTYLNIMLLRKKTDIDIAHHENSTFQNLLKRAFNSEYWPMINFIEDSYNEIRNVAYIIVGSAMTIAIDWKIYLIIIAFYIPQFLMEIKFGTVMWGLWMDNSGNSRMKSHLDSFFDDKVGIIENKLFSNTKIFIAKIKDILDAFNIKQIKTEKKKMYLRIATESFSAIGIVWGLWIIVSGVVGGSTNVGTMIFLIATFTGLSSSITNMFGSFARTLERNLYVTDMMRVFETKPIIKISDNPVSIDYTNVPSIEFKNVSFKYPSSEEFVLKDVSFKINPGEKIGLVGLNGAGKTTLIRLILRIHDVTEGEVLINGVNIREISLDKWWRNLAVLFQDFVTYKFLAKEAIACGDSEIPLDMNAVIRASEISTSSDFIDTWKNKYDEQIGVEFDGQELSKGERQKLAIAKTVYRRSKILILDEPTASVDAISAGRIFENLENLSNNQSMILISHNFSTIRKADKIILLSGHTVAEMGTHDELMLKNGLYASSFEKQKEGFE